MPLFHSTSAHSPLPFPSSCVITTHTPPPTNPSPHSPFSNGKIFKSHIPVFAIYPTLRRRFHTHKKNYIVHPSHFLPSSPFFSPYPLILSYSLAPIIYSINHPAPYVAIPHPIPSQHPPGVTHPRVAGHYSLPYPEPERSRCTAQIQKPKHECFPFLVLP